MVQRFEPHQQKRRLALDNRHSVKPETILIWTQPNSNRISKRHRSKQDMGRFRFIQIHSTWYKVWTQTKL